MAVLSRPYSDSGVVAADVFASFTEHTHNSRLLLLNGVKVCGVWYIDSMNALRSGYGPSVMMDDVGHPYGLLLSASNTECVGVILSGSAFGWIPVLAPRREKPHWAVSASSGTVDAALLTEAGIDPLPAVSTNLSLFLVPTICPFTFKLPTFDNLGPEDMSELAEAHGNDVVEWAQLMLGYGAQGENAIALYNYLDANHQLARHLGARADDLSPHTNKHGPCLSVVPCTSNSHPDDYRTLLSRLGGAATIAATPPPAPVPQQIIITSNEETKEKNTMAVGYHTLLNIMTCAKYDPDSDALTDIKFPEPTDAFKRLFELTTKDERVRSLKNMLDTNNSMRPPGSEHNMLIMSRDYDDVDILIPTAIITGIYAKTEIKDMKSASTQFTLIHFRATGKDTAIALRKERSAYQLEDAVGETEANKSKKRTTFSSTEIFTDLDSVASFLANVISAFQAMFDCADTRVPLRPLLYNCIMTLFNLVTSRKTKDWFKDHAGKMPLFPTYIALLSDKLFVGFVKSAENYTNQCAAKDGAVTKLDTDDLSKTIGTFYNIIKEIKKYVDYDKRWVDYPAFLSPPPDATPDGPNKRVKFLPPADPATPPTVGGRGPGRGGNPGRGDNNAGRSGGRGTGRGSSANTWGAGAGFGAGNFGDTAGPRARNDKGCYVLLGSTRDPARTLCPEAREQYCAKYSTQGYFCRNPSCSLKHGWFNNYLADLQAKQLAYVEANKTMVLFSPDCYPTVALLAEKRHLIAPSAQPPAPGEL